MSWISTQRWGVQAVHSRVMIREGVTWCKVTSHRCAGVLCGGRNFITVQLTFTTWGSQSSEARAAGAVRMWAWQHFSLPSPFDILLILYFLCSLVQSLSFQTPSSWHLSMWGNARQWMSSFRCVLVFPTIPQVLHMGGEFEAAPLAHDLRIAKQHLWRLGHRCSIGSQPSIAHAWNKRSHLLSQESHNLWELCHKRCNRLQMHCDWQWATLLTKVLQVENATSAP